MLLRLEPDYSAFTELFMNFFYLFENLFKILGFALGFATLWGIVMSPIVIIWFILNVIFFKLHLDEENEAKIFARHLKVVSIVGIIITILLIVFVL